ncbi:hypothetical protein N7468_002086 [Penicillium chermesinum]|uniref:Zn(2)-C6 fungal-type domain-containing protein n=1 Tax=Penicillium chermesinum TaxID=63820 RepID=A0A9W9TY13_9EURO|nr:uncharacterized protein N7468_002086 [Penicillium chermesinum]KAJ5247103.1 hypothetical protein N7468_002086 [Penicillium chermesinum]
MSRPLKQRDIACARCFRLKRKCDHAKPTCGECLRKGAECLPARSRRSGDSVTIPLAYLKELERRVAELEDSSRKSGSTVELCDGSIQTDSIEAERGAGLCMSSANTPSNSSIWTADPTSDGGAMTPRSPSQINPRLPWSPPILQSASKESLTESDALLQLYTTLYFSISHREWPFLNESAWKLWQRDEHVNGSAWHLFFLRMVYAIGASLCSIMHGDETHSRRSRELYSSAMDYYPHVVGHPSMVLQVQASLLLIVYALHSPSSEDIATTVSSIVPFCTAAMTEIRKHACANPDGQIIARSGEPLTEDMFIACYMLNVIITSGWDRPVSDAYRTVDDDMRMLGDSIQPPPSTNPALSHLFRLRKIQSKIKRSLEGSQWQLFEDRHAINASIKAALKIWRQDIPRFSKANVEGGYYHPNWMAKLYDYSILMLMEEKQNFLDQEGTEDIFAAVVEVCIEYRRLQAEGHVLCFTWSALVYQFRAGIMLLYLIWATRPIARSLDDDISLNYYSPEAINACTKSMACFADRWRDALPYSKIFEFIQQQILGTSAQAAPGLSESTMTLEEAEMYLEQLKKKYLHRAILGMIEDMMYVGVVQYGEADEFMPGIL